MNDKEYIIQIVTGSYRDKQVTYKQVADKIKPLLEQLPVKAVIMGWSAEPELYRQVRQLLAPSRTELYLWLPVFSETGLLKNVRRLIDYRGETAGKYHLNEGENFEFACPNTPQNIKAFYEIYDELFLQLPLDGVFLDRIRYASFANTRSGVFSCFCPECMQKYASHGVDVRELKAEMKKVAAGAEEYARVPLGMTGYQDGRYRFEHPVWNKFFKSKADFITEAMLPVIDFFKKKGLLVGLDVFSPFAAYFVGQDIAALSRAADFIKPMMYRQTYAPAGLPFEFAALCRETVRPDRLEAAQKEGGTLIGLLEKDSDRIPLSFVKKELANMTGNIYCGIEINYQPDIVTTSASYITENLSGLDKTDVNGFVLSWDLLSAPDSHLQAVLRHFKDYHLKENND